MSGGVDSSVAALLMLERGFDCVGCTMVLWSGDSQCCSADDVEDARYAARRLGIPHYSFNMKDDFSREVVEPFAAEYLAGRTPNPCIRCNREMKFKKLLERAELMGCSHIVTGHYARTEERDGRFILRRGRDESKDQSYVLYFLGQDELRRAAFPLGELTKPEVRAIAEENGLLNARKPDSQDICFVPDGDYARFIEEQLGRTAEPGDFVDRDGRVLGRHRGIIRYTVGQHRGLGLSLPEAMYVCAVDAGSNRVVLGRQEDLFRREVQVRDFSWVSGESPDGAIRCTAKLRYAHRPQPAWAEPAGDRVLLTFDEPQRAATPGQAAVLYDGDEVLGGGTIESHSTGKGDESI